MANQKFLLNLSPNCNRMDNTEKTITLFTTRVRQLILQFNEVKKENQELYDMVGQRDEEIKQLKEQLGNARKELETEKQNKMNKERSTGSRKSAGATTPKDDFDDAWDSF